MLFSLQYLHYSNFLCICVWLTRKAEPTAGKNLPHMFYASLGKSGEELEGAERREPAPICS